MNDGKPFYKSKAFFGGFLVIVGAVYGYVADDPAGSLAIVTAGFGLLGIGIRDAQ